MEKYDYYYYSLLNSEILSYADSYLEKYKLFLPTFSGEGGKAFIFLAFIFQFCLMSYVFVSALQLNGCNCESVMATHSSSVIFGFLALITYFTHR
jgi:hypothetical protein